MLRINEIYALSKSSALLPTLFHAFLSSADFFSTFSKKCFRNTSRVSNNLDPDQIRRNVGPGLCSNCLQRLSVDDTSRKELNVHVQLSGVGWGG